MKRVLREAPISLPSDSTTRRKFAGIASDESIGRDDMIVRTGGIDLTAYLLNPVILFDHDTTFAVARGDPPVKAGTQLLFGGEFPPPGSSSLADEVYNLVRAGVLNAMSIGFNISEMQRQKVGDRIIDVVTRSELAEISIVAIPALRTAVITERSAHGAERAKRRALAARYERELRLAGQLISHVAAPTRSTREGRARLAKLYEMDERFERAQRAFEMRPTRGWR